MARSWLMVLLVSAFLVWSGLQAHLASGEVWGSPSSDGGSTIPIPPPPPPTPVPSVPGIDSSSTAQPENGGFQPPDLSLNPSIAARTRGGRQVIVSEGAPTIRTEASGMQTITLSVALLPGEELLDFEDGGSGIVWRAGPEGSDTGVLTLPLEAEAAELVILLADVRGRGQDMVGTIVGIQLDVGPVGVTLEGALAGQMSLTAELDLFPEGVAANVEGVSGTDEALRSALDAVAVGGRIADVAYGARIDLLLTGEGPRPEVTSASVVMEISREWADLWPEGSIAIARLNEAGKAQLLDTQVLDTDDPEALSYRAFSPEGFSTFALLAVEPFQEGAQGGPFAWPLWVGMGLGSAMIVALVTGLILVRARSRA